MNEERKDFSFGAQRKSLYSLIIVIVCVIKGGIKGVEDCLLITRDFIHPLF